MKPCRTLAVVAVAVAMSLPVLARDPDSPFRGGSFRFRMGGFFPEADSAFWDVNEAVFYQDGNDFDGLAVGASYVATVNSVLELGFNLDFYEQSTTTAYRDFVDNFGAPIVHGARLGLAPLTFDLRILPTGRWYRNDRGQRRTRAVIPYLGVGMGVNHWWYVEEGDFILPDNSIAYARLDDGGLAMEAHALGGIEIALSRAWSLTLEGRYSWSEANPGDEFSAIGMGDLDLSGVSTFVGASVRF